MRTALLLAYDGHDLGGWQRHPDLRTGQGLVEEAFAAIGQAAAVQSASRTDAGVHARGQVAQVELREPPAPDLLRMRLNAALPPDLRVLAVAPAPRRWHARWSSRGKAYGYLLATPRDLEAARADPFLSAYAWSLPDPRAFPDRDPVHAPLDVPAMQRALQSLLGTRDLRGLATQRGPWKRTGRHVRRMGAARLAVAPYPGRAGGELVWLEVSGDAFLKHQVRNLVGLLTQVGYGVLPAGSVAGLVEGRRRHEGPRAPGRGLTLLRVRYPRPIDPFPRRPGSGTR